MYARMQTPTVLTNGDTSSYGLGLVMGTYRGARVVEHNGADAGYRSYVGRFPDKGLAIAIECNAATANTTALARGVADAYLGKELAPVEVAARPQGVPVAAERLQLYAGSYFQPTTLQVIRLVVRDGRLAIGAPNAPPLTALSENRFALGNTGQGPELVFADGVHGGFDRRAAGQRAVHFEWRQPVAPTAAVLAPYAGEYVSAELAGAVYRVAVSDTALTFRTGTSDPLTASLMFADTFVGDGNTIQFTRTAGRVTGFEVSDSRVRRVKFVRKP
jgi:hypothetical protein